VAVGRLLEAARRRVVISSGAVTASSLSAVGVLQAAQIPAAVGVLQAASARARAGRGSGARKEGPPPPSKEQKCIPARTGSAAGRRTSTRRAGAPVALPEADDAEDAKPSEGRW
jgi:hypothetical protein